jgi:hypothetical protein
MRRMLIISLPLAIILFICWYPKDEYKKINIRSKDVTITIPRSWQIDKTYPQFSDYRRKFGVQYKDKKGLSRLTANIYDSLRLDSNKVTENLIEFYKDSKKKIYGESLNIIEAVIKEVNNQNVAVIRYTYVTRNKTIHYGIHFFFRGKKNEFYEIELTSNVLSESAFKPIADKIFNSLILK